MRLARRLATSALAALAATGCGKGAPDRGPFTTVDSAGVEILTNRGLGWTSGEGWTVGDEPVVLGGPESDLDDGEELWQIRGMSRLPDGSVAVLSGGTHRVHVFDTEGVRVRSFGRQGEGPGELSRPGSMAFRPPDTLMILDAFQLELFDLEGNPVGSESAELLRGVFGEGTGIQPMMILPDRTLFGMALRRSEQQRPAPNGVYRPGTGYALIPRDGDPVLLGYYPGIEQERLEVGGERRSTVAPFARYTTFGMNAWPEPTYLVADTEHYSVQVFDARGSLTRIVRRDVSPVPVRDAWIERWKNAQRGMRWLQGQEDQMEVAWNLMTVRETLPPLESVALDSLGHLWVQRSPVPGAPTVTFDVFAPDGHYQGEVLLPSGLRPIPTPVIGASYFMGVWADELDVETVRIYPLDRTP